MNVTKLDLCNRVSKKITDKNPTELKPIFETFLDEILSVLSEGKRIEIRGFGCFQTKKRNSRVGRNPRTGEEVKIPEYTVPLFRFSKDAMKTYEKKKSE